MLFEQFGCKAMKTLTLLAVAVAFFVAPTSEAAVLRNASKTATILYLPIDERYATRGMFLNLASSATPYQVLTPPEAIICSWKRAGFVQASPALVAYPCGFLRDTFMH
jgi:hypothetical protein